VLRNRQAQNAKGLRLLCALQKFLLRESGVRAINAHPDTLAAK
jgi:hypothetical protein